MAGTLRARSARMRINQDLTLAWNLAVSGAHELDAPLLDKLRHSQAGQLAEDLKRRPLGCEERHAQLRVIVGHASGAHKRQLVERQRSRHPLGHHERQTGDPTASDIAEQPREPVAVSLIDRDCTFIAGASRRSQIQRERIEVKSVPRLGVGDPLLPVDPGEAVRDQGGAQRAGCPAERDALRGGWPNGCSTALGRNRDSSFGASRVIRAFPPARLRSAMAVSIPATPARPQMCPDGALAEPWALFDAAPGGRSRRVSACAWTWYV